MAVTSDEHSVQIKGHTVSVTGTTGPIHALWSLLIDGQATDSASATGDFSLRGQLPDGSAIHVLVHQSLVGPTEVAIRHNDHEVTRVKGFVA